MDDEIAVDRDWIEMLGDFGTDDFYCDVFHSRTQDDFFVVVAVDRDDGESVVIARVKKRGQLRAICAALGISLNA